jgi:hypothetical protein
MMRKRRFAPTVVVACGLMSFFAQGARASLTDAEAQAQSVVDVRRVGDAMFDWLLDRVGFAEPGTSQAAAAVTVHFPDYPVISYGDLEILLVPQYIDSIPALDGWGHPYDFRFDKAHPQAPNFMAIRSPGRDGDFSGDTYLAGEFDAEQLDEDIVWADGAFVRSPPLPPPPPLPVSDREAQKQTVADVRNTGTALFSWLTDQVGFAAPGAAQAAAAVTVHFPDYPSISHSDLEDLLVPMYMQNVPELDGWGHPYDYRLNEDDVLEQHVMAIRSPGRDGDFSGDSYLVEPFNYAHYDEDIVWADGFFARWPEAIDGSVFFTLSPCRVFDTRSASALQAGIVSSFDLGGACGIPMSAKAVAVNVTVLASTGAGHVTLFPGGHPVPSTSTVAFAAGQARASNAILALGGAARALGASASVAGGGQVHLVLDVSGYFE